MKPYLGNLWTGKNGHREAEHGAPIVASGPYSYVVWSLDSEPRAYTVRGRYETFNRRFEQRRGVLLRAWNMRRYFA